MDELKERWKISAWKTYTQWGVDGKGFFLSDDIGTRFIEKARALGVKVICVHKGLPFGKQSYEHSQCSDIGVVAKRFPDVSFLIYHSGFVTGVPERAFSGRGAGDGIDTLIRSLIENDVKPNSNVYAELGSTWRFLMRDRTARRMRWASWSSIAARTMSCGAPIRSGTARPRIKSRRFALFRLRRSCAPSTAIPRSRRSCAPRFLG